ncbi:MAG: hypothetical protein DHS20C18_30770 [Saprospiraceae bacterium]|nr:MAG: hypothetical protein DHS20C18_30770 [Saprospiraceae bacterium]
MPTIFRKLGFCFFFYRDEGNEPPHVHVEKGDGRGKYWIDPVNKAYMDNFNRQDEKKAEQIVHEKQNDFKKNWYEYFS